MPFTKEQAHSEYLDVFGNKYEFLTGPRAGQHAEVKTYEVSEDGNTLFFIMTNNVKIDSRQFHDIMMSIGTSNIQDPLYAAKVGGVNKSIEDQLGIMSEEEEAELNKRIKENNNSGTSSSPKKPESSDNPIDLILLKRKNKVNVEIPINLELEFIDKNTFDLINNTFDDAIESIIEFFMNKVDTEFMKKEFQKSIKKYIFEQFLNIEYEEEPETETIAEDPESGTTEILKWESDERSEEEVEKK